MTRSKWWWLLDVAAIVPLLAMTVWITLVAIPAYRISTNPERAIGLVAEKQARLLSDPPRFYLFYRFTAASGGEYTGVAGVRRDVYDLASVGDPFEVEYAVDAPEYHRPAPTLTGAPWFAAVGVLVALCVPLVFLAWKAVRRLSADLRQLRRPVRSRFDPLP